MNKCLKYDICFDGSSFPIFKLARGEDTRCHKDLYCICHELHIAVGIACNHLNFLTLFNAPEEAFRRISWAECRTKQCVVLDKGHRVGATKIVV